VITEGSSAELKGLANARVLVTGATGFLGTALVHRLVSGGIRVRVLVRSPAKAKHLTDNAVDVVVGDITEENAVEAALHDVTVVYHLAGKLLVPGEPPSQYRKTHVDGTNLLLRCCRRQHRFERLVHCSTTGVLGRTGTYGADETAPLDPSNVYEATKAEAELAVRAASQDRVPTVIVRPGLVYGPGDLHLLAFFRSVLRRRFRPIGRETIWLHPIYINDMTDALVRCGVHPAALGDCFHIAGRDPVSLEGLAATIAREGGTRLPRGRIPLPAARALAASCDHLPPTMRRAAPLTRNRLDFLTHSRVYDVAKASRLLGFVAATDLSTGVARSLAWYRAQGYLPAGPH
jgi:dihydroflavonol-4-reductase